MNYIYYLLILQLEAYRIPRFWLWLRKNYQPLTRREKKEPKWTAKALLLWRLGILWAIFSIIWIALVWGWFAALLLGLAFWLNSFLLLFLAVATIKPYEWLNRVRTKWQIRAKVASFSDLKVIAITGSYGKTSMKMCLQPLLPNALMTPKSYNTLFGIHKVVDLELAEWCRYFICEMGAYRIGDIREFCELLRPHYSVLTGINEQHLERFGSLENTKRAKFEVLDCLRLNGIGFVNLDNQLVREGLEPFSQARPDVVLIGYTVDGHKSDVCRDIFSVQRWMVSEHGTHFVFDVRGQSADGQMPLLGKAALSNVMGSLAVAETLGEPLSALLAKLQVLKQVPHRMEVRRQGNLTIIDNTYSSNTSSFREALGLLSSFRAERYLVTPGIVELGDRTEEILIDLGRYASDKCDRVVLVGAGRRTAALEQGLLSNGFEKQRISRLESRTDLPTFLASKYDSGGVFLLENDLPDNYL